VSYNWYNKPKKKQKKVGVATSQNWEFLFKKPQQQHLGNPKNLRLDVFA
jgi:hypothetical protein